MRAGDDLGPNLYWRYTFRGSGSTSRLDEQGQPLTKDGYESLDRRERAGTTPDTESWDGWSTPLDHSEGTVPFRATRPRQFLQVRADFNSTVDAGSRLQYLQFAVSQPPAATVVLGEITPTVASVDEVTPFTYLMTPVMRSGNYGFDRILIDTPTTVAGIEWRALQRPARGLRGPGPRRVGLRDRRPPGRREPRRRAHRDRLPLPDLPLRHRLLRPGHGQPAAPRRWRRWSPPARRTRSSTATP